MRKRDAKATGKEEKKTNGANGAAKEEVKVPEPEEIPVVRDALGRI